MRRFMKTLSTRYLHARYATLLSLLAVVCIITTDATAQWNSTTRTAERSGAIELPPASVEGKTSGKGRPGKGTGRGGGVNSIVALVNDEPITGYEIERRSSMLAGGDVQKVAKAKFNAIIKDKNTTKRLRAILEKTVKANPGKSRDEIIAIFEKRKKKFGMDLQRQALAQAKAATLPKLRKKALDELIDEKLKLQEAKRLNVVPSDAEITKVIEGIAQRNKMTLDQMKGQLGGSLTPLKDRIKSSLSWNQVVKQRFGAFISVTNRDVDRMVQDSGLDAGADLVELRLQLIKLIIPEKLEGTTIANRVADGERLKAQHKGCDSTQAVAAKASGAKYEEIGKRKTSAIPEPIRTMLLNAQDGEMLPPIVGKGGVELWVVCGRDVVKGDDEARTAATNKLRQKEFEIMGERHLKNLRQDALIEYR